VRVDRQWRRMVLLLRRHRRRYAPNLPHQCLPRARRAAISTSGICQRVGWPCSVADDVTAVPAWKVASVRKPPRLAELHPPCHGVKPYLPVAPHPPASLHLLTQEFRFSGRPNFERIHRIQLVCAYSSRNRKLATAARTGW